MSIDASPPSGDLRGLLDALDACRRAGNAAYERGKHAAAAEAYTQGIALCGTLPGSGGTLSGGPAPRREVAAPLSLLLSNRGQCARARGLAGRRGRRARRRRP